MSRLLWAVPTGGLAALIAWGLIDHTVRVRRWRRDRG